MMEMRSIPTKSITIHENERCWLGKGFSKGGLLPNDRKGYSTIDGSISWKSLAEATRGMLSRGWVLSSSTDEWSHEGDGDEWWYARDFTRSAVKNAKAYTRSPLHWVRFRPLHIHNVIFDPSAFCPSSVYELCDHCDSRAVKDLAELMLQVVVYGSALKNSTTASTLMELKREVLEEIVTPQSGTIEDAFVSLDSLRNSLIQTADRHRQLLMMTKPNFIDRLQMENYDRTYAIVQNDFFPVTERELIAGVIVRRLDPSFQLHCNKKDCGEGCRYAWMICPNEGCMEHLSSIYLEEHDETCPFKLVTCQRCGESIPRNRMSTHLQSACPLREAICPFQCTGCSAIVTAKDMANHVSSETNSHLLLAVNRMMEYEDVMRGLAKRVGTLEQQNASLFKQLTAQQTTANAKDKRLSQLQRKINTMESSSKKDLKRINELERQVKATEK